MEGCRISTLTHSALELQWYEIWGLKQWTTHRTMAGPQSQGGLALSWQGCLLHADVSSVCNKVLCADHHREFHVSLAAYFDNVIRHRVWGKGGGGGGGKG